MFVNTSSKDRRVYKTRLQYYHEILSYCKISPKKLSYLMYATENSSSGKFHTMFDPLITYKYLKRNEGDMFTTTYTITQKGLEWLEHVEIVIQGLKELEGQMSYLTYADVTKKDENNLEMLRKDVLKEAKK